MIPTKIKVEAKIQHQKKLAWNKKIIYTSDPRRIISMPFNKTALDF